MNGKAPMLAGVPLVWWCACSLWHTHACEHACQLVIFPELLLLFRGLMHARNVAHLRLPKCDFQSAPRMPKPRDSPEKGKQGDLRKRTQGWIGPLVECRWEVPHAQLGQQ